MRWLVSLAVLVTLSVAGLFAYPEPFFAFHVSFGRLSLYSDRPFDPERGRAILADVERRLQRSPINNRRVHRIFVTNSGWRRALAFWAAPGAAGVNYHPLTSNVFIRRADVERDRVIGGSGREAPAPRTLAYYAAHEIAHSLTSERLGPMRLWNQSLSQWVREGYSDYVGLGVSGEVGDLFERYRRGDPALDFKKSGQYARFRLLAAYYLERRRWSVDQLLNTRLTEQKAEQEMVHDLSLSPASVHKKVAA